MVFYCSPCRRLDVKQYKKCVTAMNGIVALNGLSYPVGINWPLFDYSWRCLSENNLVVLRCGDNSHDLEGRCAHCHADCGCRAGSPFRRVAILSWRCLMGEWLMIWGNWIVGGLMIFSGVCVVAWVILQIRNGD